MIDSAQIWLSDAKKTVSAGESLAETIYALPLTVVLTGDLGAGKTTFLQGFAKNLGVEEHLTSPTFALEQRYATARHGGELLHLDLYRLREKEAAEIVAQSDDHEGIRCIEWGNRLEHLARSAGIHIHIDEDGRDSAHQRELTISFQDIAIPSPEEIHEWRTELKLPDRVCRHCDMVAKVATDLGSILLQRGVVLRPKALAASAALHDLLRFLDFNTPQFFGHIPSRQESDAWNAARKEYADLTHEEACAQFLRMKGYPHVAEIVKTHGLNTPNPPTMSIEQKVLFYADKRVKDDTIVTVDERFADFKKRYAEGKNTPFGKQWYAEVTAMENTLFPDGQPL